MAARREQILGAQNKDRRHLCACRQIALSDAIRRVRSQVVLNCNGTSYKTQQSFLVHFRKGRFPTGGTSRLSPPLLADAATPRLTHAREQEYGITSIDPGRRGCQCPYSHGCVTPDINPRWAVATYLLKAGPEEGGVPYTIGRATKQPAIGRTHGASCCDGRAGETGSRGQSGQPIPQPPPTSRTPAAAVGGAAASTPRSPRNHNAYLPRRATTPPAATQQRRRRRDGPRLASGSADAPVPLPPPPNLPPTSHGALPGPLQSPPARTCMPGQRLSPLHAGLAVRLVRSAGSRLSSS